MFENTKRKAKTALFLTGALLTTRPAFLLAQNLDPNPSLQSLFDIAMKKSRPGRNDSDLDKCLQLAVDGFKVRKDFGPPFFHLGATTVREGNISLTCAMSNDERDNPNFPGVIISFLRIDPLMFASIKILPDGELYPGANTISPFLDNALTPVTDKNLRQKVLAAYEKALKKFPEPSPSRFNRPSYILSTPKK